MKLKELMENVIPDVTFEGFSTADDMVFAMDFSGKATSVDDYIVAQTGIKEASGTLTPETVDTAYLRAGKVTIKTGTSRAFKVAGDRYNRDEFQDAILEHDLKYGTGQGVIKPYVYFNMLTGIGEIGFVSVAVDDDLSGAASENAGFSATLTSTAKPVAYTYGSTDIPKSVKGIRKHYLPNTAGSDECGEPVAVAEPVEKEAKAVDVAEKADKVKK